MPAGLGAFTSAIRIGRRSAFLYDSVWFVCYVLFSVLTDVDEPPSHPLFYFLSGVVSLSIAWLIIIAIQFGRIQDISDGVASSWVRAVTLVGVALIFAGDVNMFWVQAAGLQTRPENLSGVEALSLRFYADIDYYTRSLLWLVMVCLLIVPGQVTDNAHGRYRSDRVRRIVDRRNVHRNRRMLDVIHSRPALFAKLRTLREDTTARTLKKEFFVSFHTRNLTAWILGRFAFVAYVTIFYLAIHSFRIPREEYERLFSPDFYRVAAFHGVKIILLFAGAALLYSTSLRFQQSTANAMALISADGHQDVALFLRPFSLDLIAKLVPYDVGSRATVYRHATYLTYLRGLISSDSLGFWDTQDLKWKKRLSFVLHPVAEKQRRLLMSRQLNSSNKSHVGIEQFLARELADICRLIALGTDHPGLPRLPSSDDDWEEKLEWLIQRCKCILYVPGSSVGAAREFQSILQNHSEKTLVLAIPLHLKGTSKLFQRRAKAIVASWSSAIALMRERVPELNDLPSQLEYRPEGAIYRLDVANRVVYVDDFRVDRLRDAVSAVIEPQSRPLAIAAESERNSLR